MSSNRGMTTTGTYDEALLRFHNTGPEFDGYLSNHGPMVVEVLSRRCHDDMVEGWTNRYLKRLDDLPRRKWPITTGTWHEALGRADRVSDWTEYFTQELDSQPWRDVLVRWWPRLLPGIAAGATHGVIRLGHVVNALNEVESAPRIAELGHALGYWASRWQPAPSLTPRGTRSPSDIFADLPRVASQQGGIRDRLRQLETTTGWAKSASTLSLPEEDVDLPYALDQIVDAAVGGYARYAEGNPTMLVHAATAPNAVAMVLPHLPQEFWRASVIAGWSASAAVISSYAPKVAADPDPADVPAPEALAQALHHGGEHVIKFTDTALRSNNRTSDGLSLTAITIAITLDA